MINSQNDEQQWIDENSKCQLWYDIDTAILNCGITEHPMKQMKLLGYTIIDAVPESIADGWRFTVDKFIEPLPKYLRKIKYNIND